eukprot:scaffold13_cov377-Prasinococcus_capsulatus_cf.AAC.7
MQRRGGVAEASFCYLVLELVQHNMHQHPSQAPHRLDAMGFDVGLRLAERTDGFVADPLIRHSKDHPRFADQLEVIKYLCKDLWTEAFGKPVDNLKTNHRGVFVLQDNKFQHLMHLSGSAAAKSVPQSNVAGHDIVICSPETSCTELPGMGPCQGGRRRFRKAPASSLPVHWLNPHGIVVSPCRRQLKERL